MRLKVEQVYPSENGIIALVRDVTNLDISRLTAGQKLRCAGYSFTIKSVNGASDSRQRGLTLESDFAVRPGMILRPLNTPLANDEVASMLMRATHILHTLCELDATGALDRLKDDHGDDTLVRYLRGKCSYDQVLEVMSALDAVKRELPGITEQREFGSVAEELNNQLGVMQLAGERLSTIGS